MRGVSLASRSEGNESKLRVQILIATIIVAASYLAVGLAFRVPVEQSKVPVGGDEHHYLTQAVSILKDGDFVVVNNYEEGDSLAFYANPLDPAYWNLKGPNGYSGHSPGTGLIVAPGLWVAGWAGVVATLALAMATAFALTTAISCHPSRS